MCLTGPTLAQSYIGPNPTCSEVVARHQNNDMVQGYILGYLSGWAFAASVANSPSPTNKIDPLRGLDSVNVIGAAIDLCKANPSLTLLNVLNEMSVFFLKKARKG